MNPNIRLELLKLVVRPGISPDEAIAMATALEAWICAVQASKVEETSKEVVPKRRYQRRNVLANQPASA